MIAYGPWWSNIVYVCELPRDQTHDLLNWEPQHQPLFYRENSQITDFFHKRKLVLKLKGNYTILSRYLSLKASSKNM